MSTSDILAELPKLSPAELQLIHERILDLEQGLEIEPSAEFAAAIEAGIESSKTEPAVPLAEARKKVAQWADRLS